MGFVMISNGSVIGCDESRQAISGMMGQTAMTVTVKGAPMTVRTASVLAVADSVEQFDDPRGIQ